MFCRNCGKQLDDNAVVCPHCGVATRATAPAAQPQAQPRPQPVQVQETNGMAIAGFVTALLGLGIIALILSIVGLNKSKQLGGNGKAFAIAGIVISVLSLVAYVISFAVGLIPIILGLVEAL